MMQEQSRKLSPAVDPYVAADDVFEPGFRLPGCGAAPARMEGIPHGMLTRKEKTAFYLLARDFCRGKGCVVDAGSFCGASTALFAQGLADNPHVGAARADIEVFDLFSCAEEYIRAFIREHYGIAVEPADSFLPIHQSLTQAFAPMQHVHPGDFMTMSWTPKTIELLFIDLAKTTALLGQALHVFMPHVIYGHTLLVHQDYYWYQQGYIPVAMEYLSDYFTPYCPRLDGTAIFRCEKPIPEDKMQRVRQFAFSMDDCDALMARCAAKLPPHDAQFVELSALVLRAYTERYQGNAGAWQDLKTRLGALVARCPRGKDQHWDFEIDNVDAEWQLGLNF